MVSCSLHVWVDYGVVKRSISQGIGFMSTMVLFGTLSVFPGQFDGHACGFITRYRTYIGPMYNDATSVGKGSIKGNDPLAPLQS
jgi:hypothetical protein